MVNVAADGMEERVAGHQITYKSLYVKVLGAWDRFIFHLETGELIAGGKTRLLIGSTHPSARPARATEETGTHDGVRLPPLRQLAPESAIWQMDHMAILPEVPLWPLDGLMLPVNMRLTCGACGPDGAQHHFSGAAHLEMLFDGSVNGWIDDIDLVAIDGMTATGSLSFSDARTGHRVVEDQFAKMFLKIGAKETNFRGTLATWMTDRTFFFFIVLVCSYRGGQLLALIAPHRLQCCCL